jgi:[acyl-carrier-protein] S-malonyltransferase
MGKDLYDNSPAAKNVMDEIADMVNLRHIPDLCFNGPEDILTRTDNVQPAITAVSLMALAAIREIAFEKNIEVIPSACAGHSLGEYAAHAAAGNLSFDLTMKLVSYRGFWMNEASQPPNPPGAMIAVMGMRLNDIEDTINRLNLNTLGIANINSPGQVILSGSKYEITIAESAMKEAGARRIVILNVSGAWHSPLMKTAQQKMGELLNAELAAEHISISEKTFVVANASADVVRNTDELKETLTNQITSPVKWEACIRRILSELGYAGLPSETALDDNDRLPIFVEVGPGTVLKGLMRGIDKKFEVINVEDMTGLEKLISLIS